jgi:hypothetical protein
MADTKVGETKDNRTDPLGAKPPPPPRPTTPEETEQIVVTVSPQKGEIVKVEKIERPGHRRELTDEEFAELVNEDELEELAAAVEEAYTAGVMDALGEDDEDEAEDEAEDETALRKFVLGRAVGRQLLRRGLRRLILRRALRRVLLGRQSRSKKAERQGRRK